MEKDSNKQEILKQSEVDADPRIELAVERTELALERTHLAWMRTVISLLASGFALDKFVDAMHQSRVTSGTAWTKHAHIVGLSLAVIGTVIMLTETIYFSQRLRYFKKMRGYSKFKFPSGILLSIIVFAVGVAVIFLLLTT